MKLQMRSFSEDILPKILEFKESYYCVFLQKMEKREKLDAMFKEREARKRETLQK